MTEENEFETYIRVSPKIIGVYVLDKKKLQNLYFDEINNEVDQDKINLDILTNFIDKNIFKIEKLIGTFVKNISLIIENKKIFYVNYGLKKKNFKKKIDLSDLKNVLTEAKDLFNENYQHQKIIHVIIEKLIIDGKEYPNFINNIKCNNLCLEVQFISISISIISEIEKVLERYQIKITKLFNEKYLRSIFKENSLQLSLMAHKINSGYNENEVSIIPKNQKNSGFFEKFFQLFS